MDFDAIFSSNDPDIYSIETSAPGPAGSLPLSEDILLQWPSGHIFGMTEDAGMGWKPSELSGKPFLILGTQAGIRDPDGGPIALGYHCANWAFSTRML